MDSTNESMLDTEHFELLIQGLITQGYGCVNDFLNVDTILGLRDNINAFSKINHMKSAGFGNKDKHLENSEVRGDKILWLEDLSTDQFELIFTSKIMRFIQYLNQTCYTSIKNFEAHYASYGRNRFYKRHLDQFKDDTGRQYSFILYLNDLWQPEDGGILSLYPKDLAQVDFSPLGGRLMFFRSDEMEHEVHPSTTRERISIAGWMKN